MVIDLTRELTPVFWGMAALLAARDGEADLARHTLSRGEGFFAELARRPVRSAAPI